MVVEKNIEKLFLENNQLRLISFLSSILFSSFHVLSRLFAKTKFAKTKPMFELLLL